MPPLEPDALAQGVMAGQKTAVSEALNLVEDRRDEARAEMAALLDAITTADKAQRSHRVGLTGPPGVGKSSLAASLARALREKKRSVGVVAVDPSSVRSGGALLGDRARMAFDPQDQGIFVRSLATAGEAGGLNYAANSAVRVLGAAFNMVLIETTGVGQTETDIMHVADTVVLVIQPGSGDVLQFLKAGIMEIPDILVVNKADHDELAQRALSDLKSALQTAHAAGASQADEAWTPPLLATSAREDRGIEELIDALDAHRSHLGEALPERRLNGEIEWVMRLFLKQHGDHGARALGGSSSLKKDVQKRLKAGDNPLRLYENLSRDYLSTRHNDPQH